jgi:hypothetical protein
VLLERRTVLMIEKRCHVPAFDGVHQNVFVLPDQELFKTASIVKVAEVSDEISSFVSSMPREAGHKYVLVNGIGAGEFWSSNRNGDYFPEGGLKHAGEDYGYQTFLSGHNFVHHDNKDPLKSVGTVKFAHYNPRMHRVELVLDTDMSKLARIDPDTYEKVANDEPVDVSMGSKCDFDVCSICSHRAATRAEYCGHLKTAMNQVTGSGQKVYAYTPHPKFFDISYVTKGADVTAKALQYLDKAASDKSSAAPVHEKAAHACPNPAVHEAADVKVAFEVPSFPDGHAEIVARMSAVEPVFSPDVLSKMAAEGFNESLSTCSHLGVILRPEEYQYLALSALGLGKEAGILWNEGAVIEHESAGSWFDPSLKEISRQFSGENWSLKVAELVAELVPQRSAFEPFMSDRARSVASIPSSTVEKCAASRSLVKNATGYMTPELAATLALGYIIYRKGVQQADVNRLKDAIHDPGKSKKLLMILVPLIAAGSIADRMMKFQPPTGSAEKSAGLGAEVLAPLGASYLYSAYVRRKAERGEPVGGLEHVVMDYPSAVGLGTVLGIAGLKRRLKGTNLKQSAMISEVKDGTTQMQKNSSLVTDAILAFGSGLYRPRLSGLLALAADTAIAAGVSSAVGAVKKNVTGDK